MPRNAIRKKGVQFGNPKTIRTNQAICADLRIDSSEPGHLRRELSLYFHNVRAIRANRLKPAIRNLITWWEFRPQKKYLAPPPQIPRKHPPSPLPPRPQPPGRTPPPGIFQYKSSPLPPGASDSLSPPPSKKKKKYIYIYIYISREPAIYASIYMPTSRAFANLFCGLEAKTCLSQLHLIKATTSVKAKKRYVGPQLKARFGLNCNPAPQVGKVMHTNLCRILTRSTRTHKGT